MYFVASLLLPLIVVGYILWYGYDPVGASSVVDLPMEALGFDSFFEILILFGMALVGLLVVSVSLWWSIEFVKEAHFQLKSVFGDEN